MNAPGLRRQAACAETRYTLEKVPEEVVFIPRSENLDNFPRHLY